MVNKIMYAQIQKLKRQGYKKKEIRQKPKISEVIHCTPANIGIFCASYQILKGLLVNGIEHIVKKNDKKKP